MRRAWLMLCLAGLLVAVGGRTAAAEQPWFDDVPVSHWAYRFIHSLWMAEVADGYRVEAWSWWRGSWTQWRFQPDQAATRAEVSVLIAKAFQVTPRAGSSPFYDVTDGTLVYGRFPLLPWVRAAFLKGLVNGADGAFAPGRAAVRQEVVAMLVRALGLEPFARSLNEAQISGALAGFGDHWQIDPDLRPELASAVIAHLVVGYPDHTLRPGRTMDRSELATVVFRAAMLRLKTAASFSPDGDGRDELLPVSALTLRNQNLNRWRVAVADASGHEIRALAAGHGAVTGPVGAWDGRDDAGRLLGSGRYWLTGWLEDSRGYVIRATPIPVELLRHGLWAALQPERAQPQSVVGLRAWTSGTALGVTAQPPWSTPLPLSRQAGTWQLELRVPPATADGFYPILVAASFSDGSQRRTTVTLRVAAELSLAGQLTPNPVLPAQILTVTAWTRGPVTAVLVRGPSGTWRRLVKTDADWQAGWRVPSDQPDGVLCLDLTALAPTLGRQAETRLCTKVTRQPLRSLRFVLSD